MCDYCGRDFKVEFGTMPYTNKIHDEIKVGGIKSDGISEEGNNWYCPYCGYNNKPWNRRRK